MVKIVVILCLQPTVIVRLSGVSNLIHWVRALSLAPIAGCNIVHVSSAYVSSLVSRVKIVLLRFFFICLLLLFCWSVLFLVVWCFTHRIVMCAYDVFVIVCMGMCAFVSECAPSLDVQEWKSTLKIVESTLKRVIQTTTLEWIPLFWEWISTPNEVVPNMTPKRVDFHSTSFLLVCVIACVCV